MRSLNKPAEEEEEEGIQEEEEEEAGIPEMSYTVASRNSVLLYG